MARRRRVQCVNKSDRQNPHERIKNIGGTGNDGVRWKLSETDAIAEIEAGKSTFFVQVEGRTVDVHVATRLGRKYLKTTADGVSPDNLLNLPECS